MARTRRATKTKDPKAPTWPTGTALERVQALHKRGQELLSRGAPESERGAWDTAVDSAMASAFGRDSPEHQHVLEAMRVYVTFLDGPSRDDYPDRLRTELDRIGEYVTILEQRLADESKATPAAPPEPQALRKVTHLLTRFSRAAKHLKTRRAGRSPVLMEDEYDVQYLLHALLDVHFDDVRPEEFGPSHAGKNVRIDFVLEKEKIAVEAKMTRDTLRDKEVGDELLVDIARYKKHPSCKILVCFVYDPEGLIKNPDGLESDLTRKHDGLEVHVLVRPKH